MTLVFHMFNVLELLIFQLMRDYFGYSTFIVSQSECYAPAFTRSVMVTVELSATQELNILSNTVTVEFSAAHDFNLMIR